MPANNPSAYLRGPDGGQAIDQLTGLPLTMQELLRRHGIVYWNDVPGQQQQQQQQATSQQQADPIVQGGAPSAMSGGVGTAIPNTTGAAADAVGGVEQLLTPEEMTAAQQTSALEGLGVAPAGSAVALLSRALIQRGMNRLSAQQAAQRIAQQMQVVDTGATVAPNVVDGTFSEVHMLGQSPLGTSSPQNAQQIAQQLLLEAPAQALEYDSVKPIGASEGALIKGALANRAKRRQAAGAKKGRAAQGTRNKEVIQAEGPVRSPNAAQRRTSATREALEKRRQRAAQAQKRVKRPPVVPVR